MSIQIKISPFFSQYTDNKQVADVKGSTVGECLEDLNKQLPRLKEVLFDKKGELHHYFDIFVNGESAYPEELARKVKDGDELHIVMLVHGG
ncbi:MoaD/ThiS family protein [Chloroflexota bacterium]